MVMTDDKCRNHNHNKITHSVFFVAVSGDGFWQHQHRGRDGELSKSLAGVFYRFNLSDKVFFSFTKMNGLGVNI